MLYAILEVYGPQDTEFAANKIEADSELEALAKYAIDQGFADPRESFTKEDLISFGNSGYFYMTDDGVRMIFTNTELRAVEIPSEEQQPTMITFEENGVTHEAVVTEPIAEPADNRLIRKIDGVRYMIFISLGDPGFIARPIIEPKSEKDAISRAETLLAAGREVDRTVRQVSAGNHLLENIGDALPVEINSPADAHEMLRVLIDHADVLAEALFGYNLITEAGDACDTLADIDEGEHVDVDRLHKIAEVLRSGR